MSHFHEQIEFGEIAEFRNGLNFRKDSHGKGCLLIGVPDFKNNFKPRYETLDEINPTGIAKEEDYLQKGDILFVRSNGNKNLVGRSLFIDKNIQALYSGFSIRARLFSEEIIPEFLAYFTRTDEFKSSIASSGGTSIQNLNQTILGNVKIPLLPIMEQKSIVKVLSDLDSKIELNNRINTELEAMAKLIYDYWFVQFDFPDEHGRPYKSSGGKMVYNKELKKEIPEGWEVGTLVQIADYQNGLACQKYRPINELYLPVIKIKEMRDGYTDKTEKVRADIPERARIYDGDVLFAWSASLEVMIWSGGNGALNQHIFKVTSDNYPKSYYYFELLNYLNHFKMIAELRKTTMGHITQDHLEQSRIAIPPIILAEKLEEKLAPLLKSIVINKKENQKLAELRDWLLPMLMNGQVIIGESYKQEEEKLGMVAEPGAPYQNDKEAIDALFETINHDYETAVIQLLTERRFGFTYGKKYTHKMFSNIEMLNTMPKFKDLVFEEKGWGMFSKAIARTIDAQKFIYFHRLDSGAEVLKVRPNAYREVMAWMAKEDNKPFVTDVENMLTIYEKSLINKDMDRIELFNTVLACMKVLETDNLQAIREKMANWKMEEEYNKTKAEKFSENETLHMIGFIKEVLK